MWYANNVWLVDMVCTIGPTDAAITVPVACTTHHVHHGALDTAVLVGVVLLVRRRRRLAAGALSKKPLGPLDATPHTGAHASLWLEDADKKAPRGGEVCGC